jgi:hypothetical protein
MATQLFLATIPCPEGAEPSRPAPGRVQRAILNVGPNLHALAVAVALAPVGVAGCGGSNPNEAGLTEAAGDPSVKAPPVPPLKPGYDPDVTDRQGRRPSGRR